MWILSKPSYTHVMGEGEEEMNNHYWEVMHVVANEAHHDILPDNADMIVHVEVDEIVGVEMPRREILKVVSREALFSSLQGKNLW